MHFLVNKRNCTGEPADVCRRSFSVRLSKQEMAGPARVEKNAKEQFPFDSEDS